MKGNSQSNTDNYRIEQQCSWLPSLFASRISELIAFPDLLSHSVVLINQFLKQIESTKTTGEQMENEIYFRELDNTRQFERSK